MKISRSIVHIPTCIFILASFLLIAVLNYESIAQQSSNYRLFRADSIDDKYIAQQFAQYNTPPLSKTVKLIVEFREEPLAASAIADKEAYQPGLLVEAQEKTFLKFEDDLRDICDTGVKLYKIDSTSGNISQVHQKIQSPVFKYRFSKVFFGQSVEVDTLVLNHIKELPYVKKVYSVKQYKITLDESVHQIFADSVWKETGNQGDSVRVGIIDTGIDYNHPDLGGGFGPGYKVVGGYDYVNNDTDPMDDNEHGTHVAGIIAADGTLKGVAPKALLYSLKVLDEEGSGYVDNILKALDWIVDPDSDNNFDDRLDIVNMSLGGTASYDEDPLVEAVEIAGSLGIVFCISAGNSGYGRSKTIESPAIAESAISVGAADKENNYAFFSSMGPTPDKLLLKPEVIAPGVDINSTVLNNDYHRYSGTSMAAPHVAGVCALLKRIHPDWGPGEMKSALMMTATDINADRIIQGAGMINAWEATQLGVLVDKPILNFGYDTLESTAIWTAIDSVTIANFTDSTVSYTLIPGDTVSGLSFSFSQANFDLSAGDSITIGISLEVDNSMLPQLEIMYSEMYSGKLLLNTDNDSYNILWSFNYGLFLHLQDHEQLFHLIMLNDTNDYFKAFHIRKDIFIPKGKYRVFASRIREVDAASFYSSVRVPYYFFIKQLELTQSTYLNFDRSEAKNKIVFATQDETGDPAITNLAKSRSVLLEVDDSLLVHIWNFNDYNYNPIQILGTHIGITSGYKYIKFGNIVTDKGDVDVWQLLDTLYVNDLPEEVNLIVGETRRKKNSGFSLYYNKTGIISGLTGDLVLENEPSDYEHVVYDLGGETNFIEWVEDPFYDGLEIDNEVLTEDNIPYMEDVKLFMTSVKDSIHPLALDFRITIKDEHRFAPVSCIDHSFMFGKGMTPASYLFEPCDTMISQEIPQHTEYITSMDYEYNRVYFYYNNFGPQKEEFSILQLLSAERLDEAYNPHEVLYIGPGYFVDTLTEDMPRFRFVCAPEADLYGEEILITSEFNLDRYGDSPDVLTLSSLYFEDQDKRLSSVFDNNDSIFVLFSFSDKNEKNTLPLHYQPVVADSTSLKIRKIDSDEWIDIPCDSIGEDPRVGIVFRAGISVPEVDSAFFELKVRAVGSSGKYLEETISPALFIRDIQPPVAYDDYFEISQDQTFLTPVSILENDINPFGSADRLGIKIADSTAHGNISVRENGTVSYSPDPGFIGTDYFLYRCFNEKYASNIGRVSFEVRPSDLQPEINKEIDETVFIFPNPAASSVIITWNFHDKDQPDISIYNLSGEMVNNLTSGTSGSCIWNLTDSNGNKLFPGVYLVKIRNLKITVTKRIIIQ